MAISTSEIRAMILQFLHDDIPHSRKKIKSHCATRLNCSKKEISSLVDEVINQLIAENSIDKESSGKFRIVKLFPSDGDFRQSILDFLKDKKPQHINVIRNFCVDRFGIPRDFVDDCINEIFMPLINEGKIERLNGEFYRLAEEFPKQSDLANLIRKLLSDGKDHNLKEIREFCAYESKIPDEALNIRYESNGRLKFDQLVWSAVFHMKDRGEIMKSGKSTYRIVNESDLPKQDQLIAVIRECLSDGLEHQIKDIVEFCRNKFNLPIEILNLTYDNDRKSPLFYTKVSAALTELHRKNEIKNVRRGFWCIISKIKMSQSKSESDEISQIDSRNFNTNSNTDTQLNSLELTILDAIKNGYTKIDEIRDFCAKKFNQNRRGKKWDSFKRQVDKARQHLESLKLIEKIPNRRGVYRLTQN